MKTSIAAILLCAVITQAESPTLSSYLQARAVLKEGIEAMGGEQALRQTRSARRDLTGSWLDIGQGHRPWRGSIDPSPPSHEYDVVLTFADYQKNRFFESLQYSPAKDNAEHATQIDVLADQEGFSALQYMDEKPFLRTVPKEELPSQRARRFRRFPEKLLLMALERPETLQWIGAGEESGRKQQVISFADDRGTRVSLYFDEQTHLLTKSEVLRDHPIFGDTNAEIVYSDYRAVGRLKLPFRYIDRVAGVSTQDWRATSIQLNVSLSEEQFHAPEDFVAMEKDPAEPVLQRLSENLYLVRAAYNVAFALFRDFVLIFEAPSGNDYSQDVLRLVRSVAPKKPIRGVIATHFHFDHIAGARAYIAEDITIFTTPDAKEVIETSTAATRTMYPSDVPNPLRKSAVIETVEGSRIFSDGSYRVELYDLGPTQHVAQMLVAYFPAERILFQADLWDAPSTSFFVTGSDGSLLAEKIAELGLKVDRIIPVHGFPTSASNLDEALALRSKYLVEK